MVKLYGNRREMVTELVKDIPFRLDVLSSLGSLLLFMMTWLGSESIMSPSNFNLLLWLTRWVTV